MELPEPLQDEAELAVIDRVRDHATHPRRIRAASSVSASTTALFDRRVRRASSPTN